MRRNLIREVRGIGNYKSALLSYPVHRDSAVGGVFSLRRKGSQGILQKFYRFFNKFYKI